MSETNKHRLPYIESSQAQKHVTHNEALRMLDLLIHAQIIDRDLSNPPTSPAEGDTYIVAALPTDDWSGYGGYLAAFQDGAWAFQEIISGFVVWVEDETVLSVWDGSAWLDYAPAAGVSETVSKLGINATPDAINKLSVASSAILFDNDGSDVQHKLNKNAEADTAAVLFQTAYSGRAEFGLTGDDNFHIKVSSNGSTFTEAMVVENTTGIILSPKQPAFSCIGNSVSAANTPLKFVDILANNGNHYDNATGNFTAPVNGLYEFSFAMSSAFSFSGHLAIKVYKNNVSAAGATAYVTCSASSYDYAVGTIMLDLLVGDTINIQSATANALYISPNGRQSTFCGRLIG